MQKHFKCPKCKAELDSDIQPGVKSAISCEWCGHTFKVDIKSQSDSNVSFVESDTEAKTISDIPAQKKATPLPAASDKKSSKSSRSSARRKGTVSLIGMEIGGCKIEKKIGQGGMGMVYKGRHLALDTPVAVKILPPQFARQDPSAIDRFFVEARSAAKLQHQNIVSVLNVGQDKGVHFIAMPFVEGGSVRDLIRKHGRVSESESVSIARQVAEGLAYAHENNIVHRDIKPDNILLDENGIPKITDLGLAKQTDSNLSLTATSSALGTPYYISPEQALDSKHADGRSDIYSLGCTLFQMLAGKVPYDGNSAFAVLNSHQNDPIPSIRSMVPGTSEALETVIFKMMTKDPEDRYQTAGECAKSLVMIEKGEVAEVIDAGKAVEVLYDFDDQPSGKPAFLKTAAGKGVIAAAAVIVIALIIALSGGGEDKGDTSEADITAEAEKYEESTTGAEESQPDGYDNSSLPENYSEKQIEKLLKSYNASKSWQDSMDYIYEDGDDIYYAMKSFYKSGFNSDSDLKITGIEDYSKEGYWIAFVESDKSSLKKYEPFYVVKKGEDLKIAWKATNGVGGISVAAYRISGSSKPVLMRLKARLSDEYRGKYTNARNSHYSIALREVNSKTGLIYGYIKNDSKAGKDLYSLLRDGNEYQVYLLIRPATDKSSKDVLGIELFLCEGWWLKPGAMCELGEYYSSKKINMPSKAVEYYVKAAQLGSSRGEFLLGQCYETGAGINKSGENAVKWYKKAALQGSSEAFAALGRCYAKGSGVYKNTKEAVKWLTKASETGDAEAKYLLSYLYTEGDGVSKDPEKAVEFCREAVEKNHAGAKFNLGCFYNQGIGVEKDKKAAVKWFLLAAEEGNTAAQYNLGFCYANGHGVERNMREAVRWYSLAAEQGDAAAQCMLGICLGKGYGVDKDIAEAVRWYRKAAEQGEANAQSLLGLCLSMGQGTKMDQKEAVKWLDRAAKQGDMAAQYNLGICYAEGRGVFKNTEEAKRLLAQAAQKGNEDAKKYLKDMFR
ncbi:MAG: protein kinase domain-containing protein [Planctomycetota bacterium]|jgi:TPR repeat protein/serine/threonine protein kinase